MVSWNEVASHIKTFQRYNIVVFFFLLVQHSTSEHFTIMVNKTAR